MSTLNLLSWQDIKDQIGEDLAIYTFYTAGSMASDMIDSLMTIMRKSKFLSETTLQNIYIDLSYGLIVEALSDHISLDDEEIEVAGEALDEGMRALVNWMDLVNNDDALAYLRYLLDWEENHFDWVNERPSTMEEFLMGNEAK